MPRKRRPPAAAEAAAILPADLVERSARIEELARDVLRLLRQDPRAALATADHMVALAAGDPRLSARAAWSRGHALSNLSRYREACDHYRAAATAYRQLGESVLAARTALGHVEALMYCGRYDEAAAIGKAARAVLAKHKEERAVVSLDMNLANILHRTDQPAAALKAYDQAARRVARLDDPDVSRTIEFNRANVLTSLGRHDEAEAAYRAVRAGCEQAGEEEVAIATVDYSLGYLRLQRSDYGGAYAALDQARTAYEKLGQSPELLALCHLDLAELLLEINAFGRARQQARKARALFEQLGLRYETAKATLFYAVAELGEGEEESARELLAEAAAGFRREGNAVASAVCDLYRGELSRRHRRPQAAETAFARAEAEFTRHRLRMRAATAALRRADLALARGDQRSAAAHLARVRSLLRGRPAPWLLAQHDHLAARLDRDAGKTASAIRRLERSVERVEHLRRRITLDEFRLSYAADKAPIYADLVDLILARGGREQVESAFAVVERARSRALVDLLAGRLSTATGRLDPAGQKLMQRIDRLKGEVNWLAGSAEGEHGRRDESRLVRERHEIESRESELADLAQRLAHRAPRLSALTGGDTITLEEVRSRLAAGTVLIEYYLAGAEARAFVVTRDLARIVRLPAAPEAIAEAIERFRFQIEKWSYGEEYRNGRDALMLEGARAHLDRLSELVWRPLQVDGERVLVVPHGPLHSLPFHALPVAGPAGTLAVDRFELSYLPSASTLRYLRPPAAAQADDASVLVVGVEDERIPKVEEEVERVRALFPRGEVLRSGSATMAEFRARAADADYVHVAAHGVFRADDPHFSALRLADGWMSVYDLYGLELKAKLVSLSACQSGRSWVGGGDELVGLVRGFLHAGAGSMLVSLWPVNDSTTADLMVAFYRALRSGVDAPAALQGAMQAVRAEHPHPYHWAPFVLIGPGAGAKTG